MCFCLHQYKQLLYSLGTAVAAFFLYYLTMPTDLTWYANSGDGGELITAAVTLGIPHPPGYPTYVLLGKLVSFLPFRPVAYRFHLFSAFCTALAAGLVTNTTPYLMTTSVPKRSTAPIIVPGLVFAFSSLVWQQAIVAEVYGLNLLMVAAFLWALLGKRPPFIIGLFLGISLTTHLTSLLLVPLALLLATPKRWEYLALGTFLGASPYLLLPILSLQGSPVIWGNPTTITGWWWLVSGQIYQANQFALPLKDLWLRIEVWGLIFVKQLAALGWPLLLLMGWMGTNGRFRPQKKWWGLIGTATLYLIYALFYNTMDATVLTLPAWLMLSLCLTPTLGKLKSWQFILPGIALLLHLLSYNGANNHNVRHQAEQILGSVPANAILMTSGDPDIFTLWYFHHVEGQRPDIILVDKRLFAFDWYRHNLKLLYPTLRALERDNLALFEMANNSYHSFCQVRFASEPNDGAVVDCLQDSIE